MCPPTETPSDESRKGMGRASPVLRVSQPQHSRLCGPGHPSPCVVGLLCPLGDG